MKNIFNPADVQELTSRVEKLSTASQALWGKMNVAQMLAHCNVSFELAYDNKHPKPSAVKKFLLKTFVKKFVVGEKPYKRNGQTAPEFVIKEDKTFTLEKDRLLNYIKKTHELGSAYFDNKEYHSFGVLTKTEWSNMFYKHLDHHLTQFGV